MIAPRRLVLDANILIRAALGRRVLSLLEQYEAKTSFYAPDICFEDAERSLPGILDRRNIGRQPMVNLERLYAIVEPEEQASYNDRRESAIARIGQRDLDDWPIVAAALMLDCPIWTEDFDFFGCGVATWTTATVELYLRNV